MSNANKKPRKPYVRREDVDFSRAYELARLGMTNQQIADCLGVCEERLYKEKRENTEIAELIKRGRAEGIAQAVKMLDQHIEDGDKTCLIFKLKCKAGWNEQQHILEKIARDIAELKGEPVE
jgi:hypothetical protein